LRTRFAPSPTGPLHLGHAYSACLAHDMALSDGGAFLVRIEDIDTARARPEWEAFIFEDLAWLGLTWDTPVLRQSERLTAYEAALDDLWAHGILYPCTCNRRDVLAAASAPNEGEPLVGPDGIVYPGTCRREISKGEARPRNAALRLNIKKALEWVANDQIDVSDEQDLTSTFPIFNELGFGPNGETGCQNIAPDRLLTEIGDVVIARRDMGTSYHLSVVIDDAYQDISHVVRGMDLFDATPIHGLLQHLLNLPTPLYHHHDLIRDETGKRLAKRHDSKAIRTFREAGATPDDIRRMVNL